MSTLRERIHARFDGHCAYCGARISLKEMQRDHIHPLRRGGPDTFENQFPACRACNAFKVTYTVEEFRQELEKQLERARRYSVNFRNAERFGLVQATGAKVVFHFERYTQPLESGATTRAVVRTDPASGALFSGEI